MHGTSHPRQTWPHEETTKHRLRGAGGWKLWTRLWEQMDEVGGLQQEGGLWQGLQGQRMPLKPRKRGCQGGYTAPTVLGFCC